MVKLYQCWKKDKGQNKTKQQQKMERCDEKAKEDSEKVNKTKQKVERCDEKAKEDSEKVK